MSGRERHLSGEARSASMLDDRLVCCGPLGWCRCLSRTAVRARRRAEELQSFASIPAASELGNLTRAAEEARTVCTIGRFQFVPCREIGLSFYRQHNVAIPTPDVAPDNQTVVKVGQSAWMCPFSTGASSARFR